MTEITPLKKRPAHRIPWRRILAEAIFGFSLLLAFYVGVVLQFIG